MDEETALAEVEPRDGEPRKRKRRWIYRALWAAAAVTLAPLGALAAALAFGPVSLGVFSQALIDQVDASVEGLRFEADDAQLAWSWERGRFTFSFVRPRVVDESGTEVAAADDIAVGFSIDALFEGRVALRRIEVAGPTATLFRREDGSFDLGIQTEVSESGGVRTAEFDAERFLDALSAPGEDGLAEIVLAGATLTFIDEGTGSIVKAPNGALVFNRTETGLAAVLSGEVSLPKGDWRFEAQAEHERGSGRFSVRAKLIDIVPASLADAGDLFAPLEAVAAPLDAQANAVVGLDGRVVSAEATVIARAGRVDLTPEPGGEIELESAALEASYGRDAGIEIRRAALRSRPVRGDLTGRIGFERASDGRIAAYEADLVLTGGELDLPELFDGRTPVDRLAVRARADARRASFTLHGLDLASGPTRARLEGRLGLSPEGLSLSLSGAIEDVPAAELGRFWPKGVGQGARDWIVENVKAGMVTKGRLSADLKGADFHAEAAPDEAVEFAFDFSGFSVVYIDGMTPMTGMSGSAVVRGNSFAAEIAKGEVGPLAVSNGRLAIDDLAATGAPALIEARVAGSVPDLLRLLDQEPLGYVSRYGLDPSKTGGGGSVDLKLSVPLLKDLDVADVGFDVKAGLGDLSIPIAPGVALTEGGGTIVVDGASMTAEGGGNVAGARVGVKWVETFSPKKGAPPTRIAVSARLDEALRRRLGLPLDPHLTGVAAVEATLAGRGFGASSIAVKADLKDAGIDLSWIGYRKAPGAPATLTANVRRRKGGGYDVGDMRLRAEGIDAALSLRLDADGQVRRLVGERVVVGYSDFGFSADFDGGRPAFALQARVLDLGAILGDLFEPGVSRSGDGARGAGGGSEPAGGFVASGRIDLALLRGGARAKDVDFRAGVANGALTDLKLDGRIATGRVQARFAYDTDGARAILLTSDDAGGLMSALTGIGQLAGGRLRADIRLPPPGQAGKTTAALGMADFRILDQPFFLRLFSAGSLEGLSDLLSGGGIAFSRLAAKMEFERGRLSVLDLRGAGPAVGFQAEGIVDRDPRTLRFTGTMVPIYGVNTVLSGIPIIGDILGGEGGLVALTFEVKGAFDRPDISVNPLSILTPGFLRGIWEFDSPLDDERPPDQQGAGP